jgi:transcriptional regulator with XRE-family HTH domain
MKKSISSNDYSIFLSQLVRFRVDAGFTQAKLAEAIGESQSTISKMERAERRIDVIELFAICKAIGVNPAEFITALTDAIAKASK